jgi:hypothetical protein
MLAKASLLSNSITHHILCWLQDNLGSSRKKKQDYDPREFAEAEQKHQFLWNIICCVNILFSRVPHFFSARTTYLVQSRKMHHHERAIKVTILGLVEDKLVRLHLFVTFAATTVASYPLSLQYFTLSC